MSGLWGHRPRDRINEFATRKAFTSQLVSKFVKKILKLRDFHQNKLGFIGYKIE